ncbi:Clp protease N-terminal domain-containing protein [Streptomyces sp. VRA16 Mangrove soil]|uniref:Clp protease N-terminal domain-containing protein n=1 Tax=Streptomyces sp. VRA16 Mangrove soil TaxID=2817434 RepID=UPI001A9FEA4D|nr:Clp protease N-terminal domain-containing protein [Streptomyces sp. VRA16 Mangrove soil]MBO1336145.1 peptidase [Streptomyces sp. VRA16 Mangrove soil]
MFERFTEAARAVVKDAVVRAEDERAERVDEGHLLLALLERRGSRGAFVLDALGAADEGRRAEMAQAVAAARRRAGLSQADAEALAELGIDVDDIVARVEQTHGVGALSGGRRVGGRRSMTREAKKVLESSLRVAVAHGDRAIGDEHLLLALASRPGTAREVLAEHGVSVQAVERVLYGNGRAAG